jgi:hypothetical protein
MMRRLLPWAILAALTMATALGLGLGLVEAKPASQGQHHPHCKG